MKGGQRVSYGLWAEQNGGGKPTGGKGGKATTSSKGGRK